VDEKLDQEIDGTFPLDNVTLARIDDEGATDQDL
jgi:hypothetical protein